MEMKKHPASLPNTQIFNKTRCWWWWSHWKDLAGKFAGYSRERDGQFNESPISCI